MTITKRNPDSEFWTACREASERVDNWPEWKKRLYEIGPLPEPTPITYRAPIPERPKPTLMGLARPIRIPVYPIPVPRVALIDLTHFEPAPKARTTITIPVTHVARIAVQQPYPALEVDYGRNGVTANEQSWHDQGQINHECRSFAVRRQRGFT